MIAMHAAVLAPERVDALVLSDPYFPALRHLEDVSRWGHWQNFRKEAEDAGVTLSADTWYDLTTFFDQVLHLDDERLLRFRQAVGLPGFKRVLRLAGRRADTIPSWPMDFPPSRLPACHQPCLALYGENSPFLATADYLIAPHAELPGTTDPERAASRPRGEPRGVRRAGA